MPLDLIVDCVTKNIGRSPQLTIKAVGGKDIDGKCWKHTVDEVINNIHLENYRYFVNINDIKTQVTVAISPSLKKYLKTANDREVPNDLLSLPECF